MWEEGRPLNLSGGLYLERRKLDGKFIIFRQGMSGAFCSNN